MDAKKFSEILSLAMARITDDRGKLFGFDELADDEGRIAWALVKSTQTIGTIARTVCQAGIGEQTGSLEQCVAQTLAQRDAARQSLAVLLAAFEADELQVRHQAVMIDKGRGRQHMAECAKDDTCQCPGRVALLKALTAMSDAFKNAEAAAASGPDEAQTKAPRMYVECIVRPEHGPDHARRRATLPEKWAEVGRPVSIVYKDAPLTDVDARHCIVVEVTGERYDGAERTRRQLAADHSGEDYWIVRPTDPPPSANAEQPAEVDDAHRLAGLLLDLVMQNRPEMTDAIGQEGRDKMIGQWSLHIQKLHEFDKFKWSDIEDMIRWSQADDFWKNAVRCAEDLRDNWDHMAAHRRTRPESER